MLKAKWPALSLLGLFSICLFVPLYRTGNIDPNIIGMALGVMGTALLYLESVRSFEFFIPHLMNLSNEERASAPEMLWMAGVKIFVTFYAVVVSALALATHKIPTLVQIIVLVVLPLVASLGITVILFYTNHVGGRLAEIQKSIKSRLDEEIIKLGMGDLDGARLCRQSAERIGRSFIRATGFWVITVGMLMQIFHAI